MKSLDMVAVGLVVAAAVAYLVIHFARVGRRRSASPACSGCAAAASGAARRAAAGRSRGTGCPGCG